jgi:hypothetical protein
MVKYRKTKKGGRKSRRRDLRRKTYRRKFRGGYSPVGPNGGDLGPVPDSYPKNDAGALPDPMPAGGVPIGKVMY